MANRIETLLEQVDELTASRQVLTDENANLKAELEAAAGHKAEADEAQAKVVELTAALDESVKLGKELGEKVEAQSAEIEGLKASQADFDSKLAAEVAKLGIRNEPVETPKPGMSAEEVREQFKAMKPGKDRTAFYNKHKDIIGLSAR